MTATAPVRRPKTLADKLFYGVGSVAYGVKNDGFSVLLMLFYNQVLHMPAGQVGLAIMIALVSDAFLDPLVGHVSDNWRSRWGRRHPFMYAAAVPVALSYYFLWNPPDGLSQGALFLYLTLLAIVVRTFITFYEIPSSALVVDLSENYDQRTSFLSFRFFFGWIGGLTMSIAAFRIFLQPTTGHPVGTLNPEGYARYGLTASVIMLAAIILSSAGTHKHIPSFRAPPPRRKPDLGRTLREVALALSNRPFQMMCGYGLFATVSAGVTAALIVYMRTYFWELTPSQISILLVSNFVSVAVALYTTPKLSAWLGKKKGAIICSAIALFMAPSTLVLRLLGLMPPNGDPLLVPILFVASFINVVLTMTIGILVTSMLADAVEDSEVKTGKRTDGLYFAANAFILKAVSGMGVFASGMVLALVKFPTHAKPGQVPAEVLRNLAIVEVAIITGLSLTALAFIAAYPITRLRHQQNLDELAARGAKTMADEMAELEKASVEGLAPSAPAAAP